MPCGFKPDASPTEPVAADAVQAVARYRVRFPVETFADGVASILPQDRLVITHEVPGLASPMTLRVLGDLPKGTDEVARRVLAERVGAGGA